MSNEKIITEVEKGLETLNKGLSKMKQALSSANQAVLQAEAYNKGLEDAWELAKKLFCPPRYNGMDIHIVPARYTVQEALAKLEAYEKEQAEIKVGDVVQFEGKIGVVTAITEGKEVKTADILRKDGQFTISWCIAKCKKTGKHIDIQSVLQQIGGDVNGNS